MEVMNYNNNEPLKVFESFAGIGSYTIALENIGIDFEIVGISEVDKHAIIAYEALHNKYLPKVNIDTKTHSEMLEELYNAHVGYNFTTGANELLKINSDNLTKLYNAHKRTNNLGDISLINPVELPDFDLYAYSAPCKDISLLGKQKGFDKDSGSHTSLLWECRKIIEVKQPKYCIMENVKSMVGKTNIENFKLWLKELDEIGYNNYYQVLNAKDYSVPQNRERVILISIRKDINDNSFIFPNKQPLTKTIKDYLENDVAKEYYLPIEKVNSISHWKAFQKPFERILGLNSVCPTITARGAGEEHSGMIILSEHIENTENLQDVAMNILNNENDYYKYKFRRLTPLEAWRLQGLSDEHYEKAKNVGLDVRRLYERAGRCVPVNVLENVFKALFN